MRRPQARPFGVRGLYLHRLAEACQRFVGTVLVLRPESFASNVHRLLDEVPVPLNRVEAVELWKWVSENATRGAAAYHAWFHAALEPTPCTLALTPPPAPSTFAVTEMTRALLDWAKSIDTAFERAHAWPPAVRAALLMEGNPGTNWYVSDLARCVNASTATLERSFDRVYGATVQQYQSLLRVRTAAVAARGNNARLEGHLLELGCRSASAVYRPLRRLTGLTLGDVRRLDEDSFQALLRGPLALPLPGFATVQRKVG